MTRLFNDPVDFADEAADGFVAANAHLVRRVTGGVVRVARSAEPRVVVVTGGGSGHYPAFAGLVGQGLAAGAAMGNLFASPSAQQVESVARAADEGRGILFSYGSYAGDVLNFDAAEAALNAAGIEARTVTVTDDISSAGPDEPHRRRGIAGGLFVWKCAAAAADRGDDLAAVAQIAARANARTRSFGVAFSGATLPGASEPLFSVAEGRMELGMGIHGEPGFDETDVPTADGLAQLLVDSLLAERPDGAERAVVILNGLGSVKYEELFVLYGNVSKRLSDAGVTIVEPEVGELVTSFDMAGVSLTLAWLDDELEQLWAAPAYTPAFRKGTVDASASSTAPLPDEQSTGITFEPGTPESQALASRLVGALSAVADALAAHAEELGRIDAVAGDGDHGIGMQRGSAAAASAVAELSQAGAGTTLRVAGDAWSDRAGGTSGALWGIALRALADAVGDESVPDGPTIAAGIAAARDGIVRFGKAEVGDKTMLDVLVPIVEAAEAGRWSELVDVADAAAASTAELLPRIGRARPHAEKSLGTPDAGAVSLALIIRTVMENIE
jgi:D-erythrulose 4-kinase